jgi:carbonic anhydrase
MSNNALPAYTADEALARLVAGNERFVRGEARFPTVQKELLAALAKGQRPYATVLGCSDSRVPPELIFDAGFGELFIVRVAGNVISPEVMGTLQYAAMHLRTPLFVVLGHEGCGAVTAALSPEADRKKEAQGIQKLLDELEPGLAQVDPSLAAAERVKKGVEANVRWSMKQLQGTPELMEPHDGAPPTIVGAVYDLATGAVRILPAGD